MMTERKQRVDLDSSALSKTVLDLVRKLPFSKRMEFVRSSQDCWGARCDVGKGNITFEHSIGYQSKTLLPTNSVLLQSQKP